MHSCSQSVGISGHSHSQTVGFVVHICSQTVALARPVTRGPVRLFPRRERSHRRGVQGVEQYESELGAPCPRGHPWIAALGCLVFFTRQRKIS